MGSRLSAETLVAVTRQMRDLGVRRFEVDGAVVELHDAAVLKMLEVADRAESTPLEAGELERLREAREERERQDAVALELRSA